MSCSCKLCVMASSSPLGGRRALDWYESGFQVTNCYLSNGTQTQNFPGVCPPVHPIIAQGTPVHTQWMHLNPEAEDFVPKMELQQDRIPSENPVSGLDNMAQSCENGLQTDNYITNGHAMDVETLGEDLNCASVSGSVGESHHTESAGKACANLAGEKVPLSSDPLLMQAVPEEPTMTSAQNSYQNDVMVPNTDVPASPRPVKDLCQHVDQTSTSSKSLFSEDDTNETSESNSDSEDSFNMHETMSSDESDSNSDWTEDEEWTDEEEDGDDCIVFCDDSFVVAESGSINDQDASSDDSFCVTFDEIGADEVDCGNNDQPKMEMEFLDIQVLAIEAELDAFIDSNTPQSQEASIRLSVIEANKKWDSLPTGDDSTPSKINFCEDENEIFIYEQVELENEAEILEMKLNLARFRSNMKRIQPVLSRILHPHHRREIFLARFQC